MFVLYMTLFLAVLLVAVAVAAFRWAVRDGQLDDLVTPPMRMLADDAQVRRRGEGGKR
jgi:cbb3-type cytochrome oxidase maturation protein